MKPSIQKIFTFFILLLLWRNQISIENNRQMLEAAGVFAPLEQSGYYTDELSVADMNAPPTGLSRTLSNINCSVSVSNHARPCKAHDFWTVQHSLENTTRKIHTIL